MARDWSWAKLALLGLIEAEANFAAVSAYRYTSLVAVQLLDNLTVPLVMVLSYTLLKVLLSSPPLSLAPALPFLPGFPSPLISTGLQPLPSACRPFPSSTPLLSCPASSVRSFCCLLERPPPAQVRYGFGHLAGAAVCVAGASVLLAYDGSSGALDLHCQALPSTEASGSPLCIRPLMDRVPFPPQGAPRVAELSIRSLETSGW